MTPTPDKLFRDRLEGLKTTPPTAAWDRIAAGIQPRRPRKRGFTIGIVVFLLLLCAGAFMVFNQRSVPAAPPPAQPTTEAPVPTMAQSDRSPLEADQTIISSPPASIEKTGVVKPIRQQPADLKYTQTLSNQSHVEEPLQETVANTTPVAINTPIPSSTVEFAINSISENQPGKKISYTAADVNAKFKRKPKTTPVDTATKTPSAIQRVLDVAYDLKYENTLLGDLRQMKDELFTSNGNGPARDK
jgi:hypothetical protein